MPDLSPSRPSLAPAAFRPPPPAALTGPPPPHLSPPLAEGHFSLPPLRPPPPPTSAHPPGAGPQSRAQPRHKVVFDLHVQHIALYDQPEGKRPLQPPMLWQASEARGALKFRLRTRNPPSVCLLMDESEHEMLIPLAFVTSLRILPQGGTLGLDPAAGGGDASLRGREQQPGETEEAMEERLRAGGIVLELGIMKGCKKDFRLREPNRYVRLGAADARFAGPEEDLEAADFTGGAARLTNLVRMTIHSTVTPELSHSMTSIVIRALRVRDGQLPQPGAFDDPAARLGLKSVEGDLTAEGFLKRGWRRPEHLLPTSSSERSGLVQEAVVAAPAPATPRSTSFIPTPRPSLGPATQSTPVPTLKVQPSLPRSSTVPSYLMPHIQTTQPAATQTAFSNLALRAPPTPMPGNLLPSNLFSDDGLLSDALGGPRAASAASDDADPERTPMNRLFSRFEHSRIQDDRRDYSSRLPASSSTPSSLPPPTPPSPSASFERRPFGQTFPLNIESLPPPHAPGPPAYHRSLSYGALPPAPQTVPESYWEPRTRSSSLSGSSIWSDDTAGTDGSLSSTDVEYLSALARLSPAHEYWATLDTARPQEVSSRTERKPVALPPSQGLLDMFSAAGTDLDSRRPSDIWSTGLAESLQDLSLAPPPSRPFQHLFRPAGAPAAEGHRSRSSTAGSDVETLPDHRHPQHQHARQKSIPLPPPPSAMFRQDSGSRVLPFYPVLADKNKW